MIKTLIAGTTAVLFTLLLSACFRCETSELTICVPEMRTGIDARIVTNAALNEVVGSLGTVQNDVEVDLENHQLIYHESGRLLDTAYQTRILDSLKAVGLDAEIIQAGFNPIKPILLPNNEVLDSWPTRCSALISIPEMDIIIEANIVVDALAYIRNGGDDPRVVTDPENREIRAVYNNVALSEKNIVEAIACTGYQANTSPPKNRPHGWSRYRFQRGL